MSWIEEHLRNRRQDAASPPITTMGSRSSFSRADSDQNWRKRSGNICEDKATWFGPRWRHHENIDSDDEIYDDDTEIFSVPRYTDIVEDESILENFRKASRYVGEYSEDSEGFYTEEKDSFHYLNTKFRPDDDTKVKKVNFDLKVAMDKAKPFSAGLFKNFLTWIAIQQDVLSSLKKDPKTRDEVKFVLTQNVLCMIMCMPFVKTSFMSFIATFLSGSIYMANMRSKKSSSTTNQFDYPITCNQWTTRHGDPVLNKWAPKYKQYMRNEDTTKGTVPNEQFRVVIASKLGPHEILYNPTMDAVNPDVYTGERDLAALLKLYCTSLEYDDDPANYKYARKLFYWTVPMVLDGINEMIVGFHDEDGIVSQLRLYTVDDLFERGKDYWNMNKNFTFAVKFLDFVKEKTMSSPGTIFRFERSPGDSLVTCAKTEADLINEWFVEKLNSLP